MKKLILAMPFNKNKRMEYYPESGSAHQLTGSDGAPINGNMDILGEHCIAIYADESALYLQVDTDRWPLDEKHIELSYAHDRATQHTRFSINGNDKKIEIVYPAWWRALGMPILPEMDEDEDYLAYVLSVWGNKDLRQNLLAAWLVS